MAAAEHVLKIRAELDTPMVVLRPGDRLIIGCQRRLNREEAHLLKGRVAEMLPGVEAVIIDGADMLAAYRPDEIAELPPLADRLRASGVPEGTIAMMTTTG